jgi:ABC-type nitrate/sulfonate/bicarbonate transport system substrate-binding protein
MGGYRAQANLPFVATYVAKEMGYFAEQNLNVEILHSNSGEHLKLLMAGDVDFTTSDATSVLKRRADPKLPIVAFALFGQRGQQAYIALKESGIITTQDWEGKTFGYKISVPPDYLAILNASNVDRSKIKEVNAGFDPRVLTERKVDILAVFKSNEPNIIQNMGHSITMWEPENFGVPNLGLTYITREKMVSQKPDIVQKFLKASLKGVEYILANREATLNIILKYATGEDRNHQQFMLNIELADAQTYTTEKHGIGWMTDTQWENLSNLLTEYGALPEEFNYQTAFTDRFIRQVYSEGTLIWP